MTNTESDTMKTIDEERNAIIEDASRKEFEVHMVDIGMATYLHYEKDNKQYSNLPTQRLWKCWQAARQSNNVPVAISKEAFDIIGYLVSMAAIYDDKHAKFYADKLDNLLVADTSSPQHSNQMLEIALERMDRARNILTDGKPTRECNWGMLDTSDLRALIPHPAEPTQPESDIMKTIIKLSKEQGAESISFDLDGSELKEPEITFTEAQLLATFNAWSAQQGWKLVPIEPTKEMIQAMADVEKVVLEDSGKRDDRYRYIKYEAIELTAYKAMLSAAPLKG